MKARFPDVYWGKTYLECYNFFQWCENHFATAGAKSKNWVPFATNFLKNTALFYWHQYLRKVEDETNVFIIWKEFQAFFC